MRPRLATHRGKRRGRFAAGRYLLEGEGTLSRPQALFGKEAKGVGILSAGGESNTIIPREGES